MWAEKGKQPIIHTKWSGRPERRTLFGAVNLKSGRLLGQISSGGNSQTFQVFLQTVLKQYPRGVIVCILDNVRFHHSKVTRQFLKKHPRIKLLFIPPYQPKLNPQEMVWKIMRRNVTHNRYYKTFAAEQRAATRFFKEQIVKFKNTLTSLIIRK